ncbi:MAG: hypothetical protein ATN35_04740 [Epulopiscium sp. Nele67-Bin004]|nr:MAG: hypothetical protein ATN35_04740 [Epulopiscium sp. Nele67-Bin004]
MPGIVAFTIFAFIFTFGEYVALKTKATFSAVFVVGITLLLGFWFGLPPEIFDSAAILPIASILVGILLTGMGNMLDFESLKQQWKTVVIATLTVTFATAGVYLIGQFIIGRDLALAGAPIFSGSTTASIVMTTALTELGKDQLALFVVLMLVCQTFVGIPTASYLLKIAARKYLASDASKQPLKSETIDATGTQKRKPLQLPDDFERPSMTMAKLGLVTIFAYYTSAAMNGAISYIVIALVYGTIFTELGFLEKNALENTKSYGFMLFVCTLMIFSNLANATPNDLFELLIPLAVVLGVGVFGACVSGVVVGRIFKVEECMAICMCLTCMFGFPTTMFMSNEVAQAIGKDEKEVEILENYLRPNMITAGFITGIISIFLAGFVAGII